jgi:hypothetical protein
MAKHTIGTQRRQIINELRHQLRYANREEKDRIRQELDFWQRYR